MFFLFKYKCIVWNITNFHGSSVATFYLQGDLIMQIDSINVFSGIPSLLCWLL